MKRKILILSMLTLLATVSCQSNDPKESDEPEILDEKVLKVSVSEISGGNEQFEKTVKVICGSKWIAGIYIEDPMLDQAPEWFDLKTKNGFANKEYDVKIEVKNNNTAGPREAKLAFYNLSDPDNPIFVTVKQDGKSTTSKTAYLSCEKKLGNSYPKDVKGEKTTVSGEEVGLWWFGETPEQDRKFHIKFPNNTSDYNRMIMTYKMGGSKTDGCAEWDMNTDIAFKYNGEWYEISNCITPYGNWFLDGTFEKKFYFDVTEYLPMLQGDVEFKVFYGGGDGKENGRHHTAQLTFDLYKGTRDKNMIFVQKLYDSELSNNAMNMRSWLYGRDSAPIEDDPRLSKRTVSIPAGVKSLQMKVTITGHGADQGQFLDRKGYNTLNAAEFDYNYYTVKVNEVPCEQKGYIFVLCGSNYKQAGTCYYDRANWCPGNPAHFDIWKFVNIKGGENIDIDLDLERFRSAYQSGSSSEAYYRVHIDLFGFDK